MAATGIQAKSSLAVPSQNHRFILLDGFRGLAALVVAVLHAIMLVDNAPDERFAALPHARLAVDFFFVLSGFVIAYAYEGQLAGGSMSFRGFFRARIARLYPFVVFGGSIAGAVLLARVIPTGLEATLLGIIATVAGLLFIPLPLRYFAPQGYTGNPYINAPEWSLFFELGINFLYAAVVRHLTTAVVALCIAVGAFALLAWTLVLAHVVNDDWNVFIGGFPRVLFSFSIGIWIFRVRGVIK